MKGYWFLPISIYFASCMVSNGLEYESVSETNLYHIARVRKGMSERQVLQIMHKPYSYETFEVEDDIYDVWFYVTRVTGLDQTRMVPQNLTPLTFKNGVLVGTEYYWYYYAMKEQAREIAAQNPEVEKPKTQEAEDADFEKTLRPEPQKEAPSSSDGIQKTLEKGKQEKLPPNVRIVSRNENRPDRTVPKTPLGVTQKVFSKVKKGMTEEEVIHLIGPTTEQESISVNSDVYDIWFYDVGSKKKQRKVPLTFKEGVLVGMTEADYNQVKEQADSDQINGYDRTGERMEEDESEQNFNYW